MSATILIADDVIEDGVVVRVVTLAQPAKKNALTPAMLKQLIEALPKTSSSSSTQPVRVVVLEGAGATFSSGFDLSALHDDDDDGARARRVDPITPAANALQRCPVPVVCAVDGACFGGAVELVAACAVRVASTSTTFCIPATRLGLVYPAAGLRRLRMTLGRNAERVLVVGAPFTAAQALGWGLVHDVVDDARAHARSLARTIAGNAPIAVSGTLEALGIVDDDGDDDAIEAIRDRALQSDDLIEGVRAQKEKRPPKFGGR
ncbi:MAG: enoyl-CoA hydratase/isomerase family protein [Deltaproteobacteria bacterium]|nr:enoyl-CoA hydratase/isomerase family protein [Deltaproteobacteria bacterium]